MNFEDYTNHLPLTRKPVSPRLATKTPNPEELAAYTKALESYSQEIEAWKAMWHASRAEDNRLMQKFFDDAAKEFGIENNPKRKKLEEIAWQMGHSYGYQEVFNYMTDLVVLIKD